MKSDKLQDALGMVKEEYLRESEQSSAGNRSGWIKWAAIAAGIMLLGTGAFFAVRGIRKNAETTQLTDSSQGSEVADTKAEIAMEDAVYGFTINSFTINNQENLIYFPISFMDRKRFNLVSADALGLTPENTYQITENDLGELMGTVTSCFDTSLIGKNVYHFASFPDNKAICILDNEGVYDFYYAEYLSLSVGENDSSDVLFAANGFPEDCVSIEVQSGEDAFLFRITDAETIGELCRLLSGRENIGDRGAAVRRVTLWQETYGNDDVYFDESTGTILTRSLMPEESTYTDSDGTVITTYNYPEGYVDPYDLAYKLWSQGERDLTFETKDGFKIFVLYFPELRLFAAYNALFDLPEETNIALKGILNN